MAPHRIGIIGFGKIAQDQHLPAIRANPDFELRGRVEPARPVAAGCQVHLPSITARC